MEEINLALQSENAELRKTNSELEGQVNHLKVRIDQLLRLLYGKKSEKLPAQNPDSFTGLLFAEEDIAVVEQTVESKSVAAHTRKVKKDPVSLRYEFPDHLRREEVVIEPSDIPEGAVKIGEEVSEKLEATKSELYVKRTIRPKYAKADRSGIVIANLPEAPVYRCMAGLSLLIRILVDKYVDHLPLNRQIERFARQGVKLKESTVCDWVSQLAKLLEALYNELISQVLSSWYIGADETTVKVLDPKISGKTHQGYLWVYLAHQEKLVLFDYDPSRKKEVVGNRLSSFRGYLQSDGYAGYEQFSTHEGITRVGCMAHARRKFDEALSNHRAPALHVLTMMQRLYRLEHLMRFYNITGEKKVQLRKRLAVPMLEEMFAWMNEQLGKVPPKSPIGNALRYALKRKAELMVYTTHGDLHIDNNHVENKIRPVAIGRKNYMFMGSHESAQRTAMLYSFFLSCKVNNIDPEEWLSDVLSRINSTKKSELRNLLPNQWSKSNTSQN